MATATLRTTGAGDGWLDAVLADAERLETVARYHALLAEPDEALDGIVRLTAQV